MNVSKRKLYQFEEYIVGNKSRHTESIFFNIPDRSQEIIKLYTCEDKDYLHDKKRDAENLIRFKKEFDIPEIITPIDILKVNYLLAKSLIENSKEILDELDLKVLFE